MKNSDLYNLIDYCISGNFRKIKELENLNDLINQEYFDEGNNGDNALTISITGIKENKYSIIEFLLQNGANPNLKCENGSKVPVHLMIHTDFEILEFTGEKLNLKGIKLLIKYGADINIKDKTGRTPLDIAMKYDHFPAESILKKYGAINSDVFFNEDYNAYKIKLHASVNASNIKYIKIYLDKGFDINYLTEFYKNYFLAPLHLACIRKVEIKTIELLIERGADINLLDGKCNTPLDLVMLYEYEAAENLLLEHGAKNSERFLTEDYKIYKQHLHRAVYNQDKLYIWNLFSKGFDINYLTDDLVIFEDTTNNLSPYIHENIVKEKYDYLVAPIHIAVLKNVDKSVLKILINLKVQINIKDGKGRTPLDIAIELNLKEIEDFLRSKGAKTSKEVQESGESNNLYETLKPNNDGLYMDKLFLNTFDDIDIF